MRPKRERKKEPPHLLTRKRGSQNCFRGTRKPRLRGWEDENTAELWLGTNLIPSKKQRPPKPWVWRMAFDEGQRGGGDGQKAGRQPSSSVNKGRLLLGGKKVGVCVQQKTGDGGVWRRSLKTPLGRKALRMIAAQTRPLLRSRVIIV